MNVLVDLKWIEDRIKIIQKQIEIFEPTSPYSYSLSNQLLLLVEIRETFPKIEKP